MPDTGPVLIEAIKNKSAIMNVNNCPGVSVCFGRAVYGTTQYDKTDTEIAAADHGEQRKRKINEAIAFGGANSETAVWHFMCGALPVAVHHFVVVPWYKHDSPHGQVYTLFMAYENRYSIGEYVNSTGSVFRKAGYKGFKQAWTPSELSTMLNDLLDSGRAWEDYFGEVGPAHATSVTYWKYKITTLKSAIGNVGKYTG